MASYTLTELNNKSGEIIEAAYEGPVDITSRGRRKFVLLTATQFDRLAGRSAQRSHHISDLTNDERDELISALDAVAADTERSDE